MNDQLPSPFVPADCDLRDFPRMMLDIRRLRASGFDVTTDDTAWRAGINLWMSAFHDVPAASLEDSDPALCKAAGLGRDLPTWLRVKDDAMRGWTLCSDGRWYHGTVSEFALEAWLGKLGQRLKGLSGNAKRWGTVADPQPIVKAIAAASAMLSALNAASSALTKASRHLSPGDATVIAQGSLEDARRIAQGSQGKGKGRGRGTKKEEAPRLGLGDEAGKRPVVFQIPEWVPIPAWEGFIEMRKKNRWLLTDRAVELIVKELSKLRAAGHDPGEVLDQSTRKPWRDVFPLKTDSDTYGKKPAGNSHGQGINDAVRRRAGQHSPSAGDRIPRHLADSGAAHGRPGQNLLAAPDDHKGGV